METQRYTDDDTLPALVASHVYQSGNKPGRWELLQMLVEFGMGGMTIDEFLTFAVKVDEILEGAYD